MFCGAFIADFSESSEQLTILASCHRDNTWIRARHAVSQEQSGRKVLMVQ